MERFARRAVRLGVRPVDWLGGWMVAIGLGCWIGGWGAGGGPEAPNGTNGRRSQSGEFSKVVAGGPVIFWGIFFRTKNEFF